MSVSLKKVLLPPYCYQSCWIMLTYLAIAVVFASLPWHTDLSFVCSVAIVIASIAAYKNKPLFAEKTDKIYFVLFLFFLAFASLSLFYNLNHINGYIRIILWIACFLVGFFFSKLAPEHNFNFIIFLIISLVFSMLIGFSLNYLNDFNIYQATRVKLFFLTPSRLALASALAMFFCMDRLFKQKTATNKVLAFLGVNIFFLLIILSSTRTLIICALACALIFIFLAGAKKLKNALLLIAALLAITVGYFIIVSNVDPAISNRLLSSVTNVTEDTTFKTRIPIWKAGVEGIKEKPIVGHGFKQYPKIYEKYLEKHEKELKLIDQNYDKTAKHAHNIFLGRAFEIGIPAAMLFFIIYIFTLFKAYKKNLNIAWVGVFLTFYLLIGLLDDSISRISDAFMLIILGAVAAYHNKYKEKPLRGK